MLRYASVMDNPYNLCSPRKLDFLFYYRRIGLHILEQHILSIGQIRDFYKILMRSINCQPRNCHTIYCIYLWVNPDHDFHDFDGSWFWWFMILMVHENFHGFSGSHTQHMLEQNAHWIGSLISEHWIPDSHLLFSFTPGLHMLEQNAHCIGLLLLER